MLAPGESTTLTWTLDREDFKYVGIDSRYAAAIVICQSFVSLVNGISFKSYLSVCSLIVNE